MMLIADTDAFCKLGISGLLHEAVDELGLPLSACRRLAALPFMLRRGALVKKYGSQVCAELMMLAESIDPLSEHSTAFLGKLVDVSAIDPGEALIFASAAETKSYVLTGDKQAIRALGAVVDLHAPLAGRIVTVEGLVCALCKSLGDHAVSTRIQPTLRFDQALTMCFSPGNANPRDGLQSYHQDLARAVAPLVLWEPNPEAAP